VEQALPAIDDIFGDRGGNAIVQLGEHFGKAIKKVSKSQVRKFLTELKSIKKCDEFHLNRFRWVCRYLVAQEKSLKDLGDYLEAAAKQVAILPLPDQREGRFQRLQSLMESIYAHYLYEQ
jgi:hypothetical protein